MTKITRRTMLAACSGAVPLVAGLNRVMASEDRDALGLVIDSFPIHIAADRPKGRPGRFADPVTFLEYCRGLGARGVQVGIGIREPAYADELRAKAASTS